MYIPTLFVYFVCLYHIYILLISIMCICIFLSIPATDITWSDLIMIKPWLGNQSISGFISLQPDISCDNFANLLLKDSLVVQNLRDRKPTNKAFVNAVLNEWYSGTGTPVPFTWSDLIQCMRNAGLHPRTVKIIEENVGKLQRPCESG